MKFDRISDTVTLIDVEPPIPGWSEFIGIYVLIDDRIGIIDVGPQVSHASLIDGLKALAIDPKRVSHVMLTHIHLDHAGAIGELIDFLPNAVVVVHPRGAPHLINTEKLWDGSLKTSGELALLQGRPRNIPESRVISAHDGMRISLGERIELEVIHTPGHASHHVSFLDINSGMLFVGEASGICNMGAGFLRLATPPPLVLEPTIASIDRLLERHPTGICYSHFGFSNDAEALLRGARDQLELWKEIIADSFKQGETDPESILPVLIEKDTALEKLQQLSEDQMSRERYFMTNSVKGFIEYLSRNPA